ncbi:MAG: T9SS type A sorting domain-containing protein [Candidatus Kapabacteria bacterium]|nr:T9SS type A sorting domain-containing protein [Ignavibacteriota bacterium]MCW5883674.1 T9SS type A sorting domain-containing protein [Candidatus Kapabacteria bacterium]
MKKFTLYLVAFFAISSPLLAQKFNHPELQSDTLRTFESKKNTVSNIQFGATNYGISNCYFNFPELRGVIWPRNSDITYSFGSGLWIGASKYHPDSNKTRNMVLITYNPNSGKSWAVPGRIEDGNEVKYDLKKKYRTFLSTEYNTYTGEPFDSDYEYNWSHWISNGEKKYSHGVFLNEYEHENSKRNRDNYLNGPLIVSDEDIVTTFKDTDLNFYEGGSANRLAQGYPLSLQMESSIYSWSDDLMKDVIIQRYVIENKSNDTLKDCWIGNYNGVGIGLISKFDNKEWGTKDRLIYYEEDKTLNLFVAWSENSEVINGKGFGYFGVSLLETPAVDSDGFLRNDKLIYQMDEQIGLKSLYNWHIKNDPRYDEQRYDILTSNQIYKSDDYLDGGRVMTSTGPFHFRPGEKAYFTVLIAFALPAKGGEADGTKEDIAGIGGKINKGDNPIKQSNELSLIDKIKFARDKYYNGLVTKILESEVRRNSELSVYPNPATDFITIQLSKKGLQPFAATGKVQIFDALGLEVISTPSAALTPTGEGNLRIDVSHLPAGVYFIRVGNKVGKFVKK